MERTALGANADNIDVADGSLVKAWTGQIVPCLFLNNTLLGIYVRAGNMTQREKKKQKQKSTYHINLKT